MADGAFYRWLVTSQIEPTFRDHAFVQRACVLVVPRLWRADEAEPTVVMIAYAARESIELDGTIDAIVTGAADPNLPAGVTSLALHRPVEPGATGRLLVELCAPPFFAGWTRGTEHDVYEGLDGFAVYAVFARGRDGEVVAERVDAQLGARIDRVR